MSIAPPEVDSRTRAEAVADALFMLVHRGFFPNRDRVHEACRVVGLSVEDLHLAAVRLQPNPGRYQAPAGSIRHQVARVAVAPSPAPSPPDPGPPAADPPAPPPPPVERAPEPPPAPRAPAPHAPRSHGGHRPPVVSAAPLPAPAVIAQPGPEVEYQCDRCHRGRVASQFVVRGGHRARNCRLCEWMIGRRRRYEEALGHELLTAGRWTVLKSGNPLLEGDCALECGQPLLPGQPLIAVDVVLAHRECIPGACD